MKSYVIFDMDGVIIDSETWYHNVLNKYLKERNIVIPKNCLDESVGLSMEGFYSQNLISIPLTKEEFLNDYFQYINQYGKPDYEKLLFPSVKECFQELYNREIDIIIASSSPRDIIEEVLRITELNQYVKFYLGEEDVRMKKPDPEIYLKVIHRQGYKPLFVVEDSYYGIQSAKAAGLKVIAYSQRNNKLNQSHSDFIVFNHLEILNYC